MQPSTYGLQEGLGALPLYGRLIGDIQAMAKYGLINLEQEEAQKDVKYRSYYLVDSFNQCIIVTYCVAPLPLHAPLMDTVSFDIASIAPTSNARESIASSSIVPFGVMILVVGPLPFSVPMQGEGNSSGVK